MATFKIYTDAALTVEFVPPLSAVQNADGSTARQDFQFWLGSAASGKTLQADSNPGVDQIALSVVDAAASTGHAATEIKLATSQAGLAGATGGAALNLATAITSGVANAKTFWVGWKDTTGVVGTSTELSITTNLLRET
jgi:hypothetical protein